MQAGYLLKTDGTRKDFLINKKFTLKFLQECVGGYIEHVKTRDNKSMVVNEEGMYTQPPNAQAFRLLHDAYKRPYGCTDAIYGDVFIFTKGRL